MLVMQCKLWICKLWSLVFTVRLDARVSRALFTFKQEWDKDLHSTVQRCEWCTAHGTLHSGGSAM